MDFSDLKTEIGSDLYPNVHMVHKAPSIIGSDFDPVALIHAVNVLHALGKEKAITILRTYIALSTSDPGRSEQYDLDEQRVFLVLRLLFVQKYGKIGMPPLLIGASDVVVSHLNSSWPLFPIAVVNQIPFLLVSGYTLGGFPQNPLDHLDYCLQFCQLRHKPIEPESSSVDAVESLLASERWQTLIPDEREYWYRGMLYRQALRALTPLYTVSEKKLDALYPQQKGDLMSEWHRHVKSIMKFEPRWDPVAQQFISGK